MLTVEEIVKIAREEGFRAGKEAAIEELEARRNNASCPEWMALKDEIKKYSMEHQGERQKPLSIQEAVFLTIKNILGLKLINQIKPEQIPKAREIFEEYKKIISK